MGEGSGGEAGVVTEEIIFCDLEFPIEDVEELSLDTSDISLSKDTSAECPMDVL